MSDNNLNSNIGIGAAGVGQGTESKGNSFLNKIVSIFTSASEEVESYEDPNKIEHDIDINSRQAYFISQHLKNNGPTGRHIDIII